MTALYTVLAVLAVLRLLCYSAVVGEAAGVLLLLVHRAILIGGAR